MSLAVEKGLYERQHDQGESKNDSDPRSIGIEFDDHVNNSYLSSLGLLSLNE